MRSKIVAGNWKMNLSQSEAKELCKEVNNLNIGSEIEVYIFPPMLYVSDCKALSSNIKVGAQNAYPKDTGAFTGEVSAIMLRELYVTYVIVGHSERRTLFGEQDAFINKKVIAALKNQLRPILCVGETLAEREAGTTLKVVQAQVEAGLEGVSKEQAATVVARLMLIGPRQASELREKSSSIDPPRTVISSAMTSFSSTTALPAWSRVTSSSSRSWFSSVSVTEPNW